jgi:ubiquinone/menaquinone biosynthesis C-methylase UbiE
MGFYSNHVVPCLLHAAMRQEAFRPIRARVAGAAVGSVLEIGIGSGLNMAHYGPGVSEVTGIDPSAAPLRRAGNAAGHFEFPVRLIRGTAEALPFRSGTFDTIVTTWTLCTIPEPDLALAEFRRVLRRSGTLLFVEHGHATGEPGVCRWQDRLDPLWSRIAGGCHLNRRIADMLRHSGFQLQALSTGRPLPGPRTHTFFYEGRAIPY